MRNKINKFVLTSSAFALLAIGAVGCSPTIAKRGNMLEDYQMEKIVTGIHTRTDVLRILGSPTTQAPFDDNTWYYIGQETEKRGIMDPEIKEERIVVVTFDDEGIVQTVDDVDPHRLDIPVARAKTPTHGHDLTLMQQLLGNLGRFNNAGEQSAPAGSSGRI